MDAIQWLLKHNGDFARVVHESLIMLQEISTPPNGKGPEEQ